MLGTANPLFNCVSWTRTSMAVLVKPRGMSWEQWVLCKLQDKCGKNIRSDRMVSAIWPQKKKKHSSTGTSWKPNAADIIVKLPVVGWWTPVCFQLVTAACVHVRGVIEQQKGLRGPWTVGEELNGGEREKWKTWHETVHHSASYFNARSSSSAPFTWLCPLKCRETVMVHAAVERL